MLVPLLQLLQPATTLILAATQLSNTWFSLHPPLMAVGFTGFLGQGVLTSLAVRGVEGDKRAALLTQHALWQVSGLLSIAGGLYATYISKELQGPPGTHVPHFANLHARLGLTAAALATLSAVGGALAFGKTGLLQLFPRDWQPRIKRAHRSAGLITILLAYYVMCLGLQLRKAKMGTLTAALQGAIAAIAALTAWLALQPAAKHALQRQQKQQ